MRKKIRGAIRFLLLCTGFLAGTDSELLAGGVDSVRYREGLAAYKAASQDYLARNWPAAFAGTGEAARLFLAAGDTSKACAALELQSLSCPGRDSLALAIVDRALDLYAQGPGDTSYVYFRLHSSRMRCLRQIERYAESALQGDLLSTLQARLVEVDRDRGMEAAFSFLLEKVQVSRDLGNLSKGIEIMTQAIIFDQDNPDCVRRRYVAEAHSLLAALYRRAGNLPLARQHHAAALSILAHIPDPNGIITYTRYRFQSDFGAILISAKDYAGARQHLHATLAEARYAGQADATLEAAIFANLGQVFLNLSMPDSAWILTSQARDFYMQDGASGVYAAKMEINLAAIANARKDHAAAVHSARQAVVLLTRHDAASMEDRAKAWKEAGLAYLGMGLADSTRICLPRIQSEQLLTEQQGVRCPAAWRMAADGNDLLANFDSAEVCLRRALQACFVADQWRGDPTRIPFDQLLVDSEYLSVLGELARIKEKQYQLTGCIADLGAAFCHAYRATRLIAYMDAQRQDLGMASLAYELLWRNHIGIVERAIRTSLGLYRHNGNRLFPAMALALSDMSKARQQGKRGIASDQALASLLAPDLRRREQDLALALEADRRIASGSSIDDPLALAARQRTAAHAAEREQLMEEIRLRAPRYHALRYQDIAHWERILGACLGLAPAGRARLEYFVGQDKVYAFLQTETGLEVATLSNRDALEEQVTAYQLALLRKAPASKLAEMGRSISRSVFPFAPPAKAVQGLTIVPDGFLFGLPFHTLVWHHPLPGRAFAERTPYWAYGPPMGRGFSLALQRQAVNESASVTSVEGFFPMVSDTGGPRPLPMLGPNPSLVALQGHADVQTHEGAQATKAAFLAAMATPGIKELKTHGLMDGEEVTDPYLLLADSAGNSVRLHASELYDLPGKAAPDLVVLNACVTAQGDYLPGEGQVSLVRAFAKAGCPTLLANAWDASEAANTELSHHFYTGLAQGMRGTEALRHARVAALESADEQLRQPYNWACLEFYGPEERLFPVSKPFHWRYLLAAVALIALLKFGIRRARRTD